MLFAALFFMVSCSDDSNKDGKSSLISFFEEEAGENCVNGGTGINTGIDVNGNGSLDEGEINDTRYICKSKDGEDGTDGENGSDGKDGLDGKDGVCAENNLPTISDVVVSSPLVRVGDTFSVTISATDPDENQGLTFSIVSGGASLISSSEGVLNFTAETAGTWSWKAVVSDGCGIVIKSFDVVIADKVYSGFDNLSKSIVKIENNGTENKEYVLYFTDYNSNITPIAWKVFKLNSDSDLSFTMDNTFQIAVIKADSGSESVWYIPEKNGDVSKLYTFEQTSDSDIPKWFVSDEGYGDGSFYVKNSSSSYKAFSFYLMNNENAAFKKENVLPDESLRFAPIPKLYLHKIISGETAVMGDTLPASFISSSDVEIDLLNPLASNILVKCSNNSACTVSYGETNEESYSGVDIKINNNTGKNLKTIFLSSSNFNVFDTLENITAKAWKSIDIASGNTAETVFSTDMELAVYDKNFPQSGDLRRTFVPGKSVAAGYKWNYTLTDDDAFAQWSSSEASPANQFQVFNNAGFNKTISVNYLRSGSPFYSYNLGCLLSLTVTFMPRVFAFATDNSSIANNDSFSMFSMTYAQTEISFLGLTGFDLTISESSSTGSLIFSYGTKKSFSALSSTDNKRYSLKTASRNIVIKNNTSLPQKIAFFAGKTEGAFKPVIWKLAEIASTASFVIPVNENWQLKGRYVDPFSGDVSEFISPSLSKGDYYSFQDNSGSAEWSKNSEGSGLGIYVLNRMGKPYFFDVYRDGKLYVGSYFKATSDNLTSFYDKGFLNFSVLDSSSTIDEGSNVPESASNSSTLISIATSDTIQITLDENSSGVVETTVKYGE